jgi:hypothetical protein
VDRKAELQSEITRIKMRLAWLVKMYVRHYEKIDKREFIFRRMQAYTERLERYERIFARIS